MFNTFLRKLSTDDWLFHIHVLYCDVRLQEDKSYRIQLRHWLKAQAIQYTVDMCQVAPHQPPQQLSFEPRTCPARGD